MSKRVEVLILAVLAAASLAYFGYAWNHTAGPVIATGAGPGGTEVTPTNWMTLGLSAVASLGFTWNAVIAFAKNLTSIIPVGPWRTVANAAIDATQEEIYVSAFKGAKSKQERDTIRTAAKLAAEKRIAEKFPEDQFVIEVEAAT